MHNLRKKFENWNESSQAVNLKNYIVVVNLLTYIMRRCRYTVITNNIYYLEINLWTTADIYTVFDEKYYELFNLSLGLEIICISLGVYTYANTVTHETTMNKY